MNFIKKYAVEITAIASTAGALLLAGITHAADPFATSFSSLAAADLTAYTGYLFTDLWVVIALVIGIPLAFYVIRKIISLVRMH
jgi:hypothetical protein